MAEAHLTPAGDQPAANVAPSRLTVVEAVYFQQPDSQPLATDVGHTRILTTGEQPYVRRTVVGTDWRPLDCGWLADAGASMLLLVNLEGRFDQVNPTAAERADAMARVIELGLSPDPEVVEIVESVLRTAPSPDIVALVVPSESLRLTPHDLSRLRIRCQHGTARYTLTLYPK